MGWTDVDESREVATWGERKAVIIPGSRSPKTGRSATRMHRIGAAMFTAHGLPCLLSSSYAADDTQCL
ncbi:hypothetical protein, partial [Burkholderia cepacia]|uniref:hypothetical protein n=1 Tax=Burkholderia cepacia TaxID=292 RepID=UPI001D00D82E